LYAAVLPPAERAKFLSTLANPTALEVVNISGELVEFHSRNALVGTAPGVASSTVPDPSSQKSIWIHQIQEELVAKGFPVDVDGKLWPKHEGGTGKVPAKVWTACHQDS
jgi:hypothetical protein